MDAVRMFHQHVDVARQIARELREHSSSYDAALRTSIIPSSISDSVARFIAEIQVSLDAVTDEVGARLGVKLDVDHPWRNCLLEQVRTHSASALTRVQAAIREADADGWLDQFEGVSAGSLPLQLRRGAARVTIVPGPGGDLKFDTRSPNGSSLLTMGPMLLDDKADGDGVLQGYYLAVFDEASELALFLNRVLIGIERLGAAMRTATGSPP